MTEPLCSAESKPYPSPGRMSKTESTDSQLTPRDAGPQAAPLRMPWAGERRTLELNTSRVDGNAPGLPPPGNSAQSEQKAVDARPITNDHLPQHPGAFVRPVKATLTCSYGEQLPWLVCRRMMIFRRSWLA